MEGKTQSAFAEERLQLTKTAAVMEEQLELLEQMHRYTGHDFTEQLLEETREIRRQNLKSSRQEPYFARLDFEENGTTATGPLYIGKKGIEHEATNKPLVIDWRAPVASLFYSFTGGDAPATYECPEGTIEGKVHLKRNIVIRKQELERVVDTYSDEDEGAAATDEFLLYRLGENKDNKLRDIVSTIQAEQDRIIRSPRDKALIIQGVAGSGKTTVALHRLAFLLYQYREQMRAERMIIFAPNRMFLDYISGVLPELGVGDIQQTTFNDWALEVLENEVKLVDASKELEHWFAVKDESWDEQALTPGRFKGSVAFMQYLEACLAGLADHVLPDTDYEAWEMAILPAATIREWFDKEYAHYPLMKRKERVTARIERWLTMELEQVRDPNRRKEFKKKANARLKAYLKTWAETRTYEVYLEITARAKESDLVPAELKEFVPAQFAQELTDGAKSRKVREEDLPALAYLRYILYGDEGRTRFDHVVIDEAQDFSPFQVALLRKFTREGSFSILGDLSQGIHAYKGIRQWQEFTSLFGENETGYFQLEQSYRSTMEIIEFANEVLVRGGGAPLLAVPVFRSGRQVGVYPAERQSAEIARILRGLDPAAVKTTAVIGRTAASCRELARELAKEGIEASLLDAKQATYGGGLSVVPAYLAKGLEFDAVIVADADARSYRAAPAEAKLLYVACTRALHELHLVYSGGEVSPLVRL
ncbi:helicase UvrD [Paenibacillus swuensis]|uniref:Helicase UvrD n=1 Tax=Paenibacillus swuensis TaxID=1178515 RepID=A0A172TMD0_9BACL|nr:UvrD-helicase domain-containing protein [Paenibacillus swuensis]ANE48170.1 helicase UvrD [Paenibacillus swuensis]